MSEEEILESMRHLMPEGVDLLGAGGTCPFQAEGRVDGYPFYFRARGQHWSLQICLNRECATDYCSWPYQGQSIWIHKEQYSEEEFAAGWISSMEAAEFIAKAVDIFRSGAHS
jgi:hypothetical protein